MSISMQDRRGVILHDKAHLQGDLVPIELAARTHTTSISHIPRAKTRNLRYDISFCECAKLKDRKLLQQGTSMHQPRNLPHIMCPTDKFSQNGFILH